MLKPAIGSLCCLYKQCEVIILLDMLLNLIEVIAGYFPFSGLFVWLFKKLIRLILKYFLKKLIKRIKQRS